MVILYKELLKKYKNLYNIKKALARKEVFFIDKGIYSDKSTVNPLIIYSKKYKNAVITLDSAFYYYDFTDVAPQKTFLATSRDVHSIKNKDIFQIFIPKDLLNVGKTQVTIDGEKVNMYDKERLLIELIRKRNKLPFDYYKEIIYSYRSIIDQLDMEKLENYLSYYKNGARLFNIIQREVF